MGMGAKQESNCPLPLEHIYYYDFVFFQCSSDITRIQGLEERRGNPRHEPLHRQQERQPGFEKVELSRLRARARK